jgi:hypothetical protein
MASPRENAALEYLPKEQSERIARFGEDAMLGADELADQYRGGGLTAPFALTPPDKKTSVALENKMLHDIVDRRALKTYRNEMKALETNVKHQAINDRFSRLNNAARLTAAEYQYNHQVDMNRYADRINRKRARASVLGNVLGIAGAIYGGVAGGPQGAFAGYQIGQGTGNLAGSL